MCRERERDKVHFEFNLFQCSGASCLYKQFLYATAGLVGLKKLQYLDFTYCSLEGSFPVFNGEFGALEVLVLNHNHLNRGLSAQGKNHAKILPQASTEVKLDYSCYL